jgi:hypothetical protein
MGVFPLIEFLTMLFSICVAFRLIISRKPEISSCLRLINPKAVTTLADTTANLTALTL